MRYDRARADLETFGALTNTHLYTLNGLGFVAAREGKTEEARRTFYGMIALATLVGILINFSGLSPIKALYYSAVINGLVAIPIIVIMMLIAADAKVMGQFKVGGWLSYLGWATAAVMAAAGLAMLLQMF